MRTHGASTAPCFLLPICYPLFVKKAILFSILKKKWFYLKVLLLLVRIAVVVIFIVRPFLLGIGNYFFIITNKFITRVILRIFDPLNLVLNESHIMILGHWVGYHRQSPEKQRHPSGSLTCVTCAVIISCNTQSKTS